MATLQAEKCLNFKERKPLFVTDSVDNCVSSSVGAYAGLLRRGMNKVILRNLIRGDASTTERGSQCMAIINSTCL